MPYFLNVSNYDIKSLKIYFQYRFPSGCSIVNSLDGTCCFFCSIALNTDVLFYEIDL